MRIFLAILVASAGATCAYGSQTVEFTYDPLPMGASVAAIESYMAGLSGFNVHLTGGTNEPHVSTVGPLGDDYGPYVYAAGETGIWVEFRFGVPVDSCEFHWAVLNGTLRAYADDDLFLSTDSVDDAWNYRNNPEQFDYESPVHSLRFEGVWDEGVSGAIGIDNLIIAVPIPGDADLDGDVDLDDFIALKINFGTGTMWAHGDFDGDLNVDLDDFVILKNNFGAAAIAEPATLSLTLGAALSFLLKRKRSTR